MLVEHRGKRPTVAPSAYVAPTGRGAHPVELGDDVLIGPHAHVNGSVIGSGWGETPRCA